MLLDKREMIDEYFSLKITKTGNLDSLPLLLKGYTPDLDRLPHFLLCLGARVDWNDEKECFKSVLKELAFFYSPRPLPSGSVPEDETEDEGETERHARWQLEHVLWPSMRKYTSWSRESLSNGDLKQVANLPDLFRIFERC
jgi:DNA mismatch repair protein MLH1